MASSDNNDDDNNDYVSILSECTILPSGDTNPSPIDSLRLSASDLPMLTFQYVQIGCLFSGKPEPITSLICLLKLSISKLLSIFPPLAGRLSTDPASGHISIACSGAGALFVHAGAPSLRLGDVFDLTGKRDHPKVFRRFFQFNDTLSYDGHTKPIIAMQVTELADSVFIGWSLNHAVIDGVTFSNFFRMFGEICRGATSVSRPPCFSRGDDNVFSTDAVLQFPGGRPKPTFSNNEPTRERMFHFSAQAVLALKEKANAPRSNQISSFQALSALVWQSVTRARKLAPTKTTSFVIPVNCRDRVNPKMEASYFGNAIQIIRTSALAREVAERELGWSADLLHRTVNARDDRTVRKAVEEWERDPHCFPLGNSDGATIIVGNSPRFDLYDIDFGLGRAVAIRAGKANKFDGKFAVFPGREGKGSIRGGQL